MMSQKGLDRYDGWMEGQKKRMNYTDFIDTNLQDKGFFLTIIFFRFKKTILPNKLVW